MSEDNSYRNYWGSVRGIANDIRDAIKEGEITEEFEIMERVESDVDGSQWVIYTGRNMECLLHSRNEDAYFEQGNGPLEADNFGEVMQRLAYYAMIADVNDELGSYDDLLNTEDDEEDEDEDEEEDDEEEDV